MSSLKRYFTPAMLTEIIGHSNNRLAKLKQHLRETEKTVGQYAKMESKEDLRDITFEELLAYLGFTILR